MNNTLPNRITRLDFYHGPQYAEIVRARAYRAALRAFKILRKSAAERMVRKWMRDDAREGVRYVKRLGT